MKSSFIRTAIALIALAITPSLASAQTNNGIVAVLDMNVVFESHLGFKAKMEGIKADVASFEESLKQRGNSLRQKLQNMNEQWKPGSPEYQKAEESLAQEDAKLGIQANQKRKQVADLQAQAYFETYQDVLSAVKKKADEYNVTLVLRYDSSEINRDDRNEVIRGVNRNVIFQRDLDLTDIVLAELGYQRTAAAATAKGAGQTQRK